MKKSNYEMLKKMKAFYAFSTNNCSNCGNERDEVQFKDLPETSKKGFKELMNLKPYRNSATTFLYCKECNEFSILSSPF